MVMMTVDDRQAPSAESRVARPEEQEQTVTLLCRSHPLPGSFCQASAVAVHITTVTHEEDAVCIGAANDNSRGVLNSVHSR